MRNKYTLALLTYICISISALAQTWEIYDLNGNLTSRAIYDEIQILGETVTVGKNSDGLFLLSSDLRPMLNLQGEAVFQYLQPWIIVQGPKGIGAFHEYGQLCLPLEYEEIKTYTNILLARKGNNYWLFERGSGKTTALGQAEEAIITHHGMIILKKNGSFYLPLSKDPGKPYQLLSPNEGNFLLAKETTGYGLINREGEYVLDPIVDQLEHTRGNYYYGFDENQYLLIRGDEVKAQVTYNSYHKITKEGDLMLEYIHGKLRRVMEEDGILLDAVGIESVQLIGKDLYNVHFRENKTGLLGKKGWLVQPTSEADWIGLGNEGLFPARKAGKFGYLDTSGQWSVPPQFAETLLFSEQVAAFRNSSTWGLINSKGTVLSESKWDEIKPYSNGIAVASLGGAYYLLNNTGEVVNPLGFDKVCRIKEGYFLVEKDHKKGLLDQRGNMLLPLEFDHLQVEQKDFIIADKGGSMGAIRENGDIIFPFEYQQIQADWIGQKILAKAMYHPVIISIEEPVKGKRKKGA